MEDSIKKDLTDKFEKVLTIDGRGRVEKARLLLGLLQENTEDDVYEILEEIAARKFI